MPLYIMRSARGLDHGGRRPYEVLAERGGGPEPWAYESLVECDAGAARELGERGDVAAVETAPPGWFEGEGGGILVHANGDYSFEDHGALLGFYPARGEEGDGAAPHQMLPSYLEDAENLAGGLRESLEDALAEARSPGPWRSRLGEGEGARLSRRLAAVEAQLATCGGYVAELKSLLYTEEGP
jgi:hypothetical protein